MVQTIETASRISVQGEFVRKLADGRVEVRVGELTFAGLPVKKRSMSFAALSALSAT